MLDTHIFDPWQQQYKSPFGAVPCGTAVRFFTGAPAGAAACSLVVSLEFQKEEQGFPMARSDAGFALTFTAPAAPDLVWYFFRFTMEDGSVRVYGTEGFGKDGNCPLFQLTVYDDTETTPAWFGEGVTYQIFPDRFCRLEKPDPTGMIGDRWVHENWEELPAYLPEDGEIRNRDFFGGSLKGILSRLDYLESLSVSTIYLNPIFEAASNHRYDTCDYEKIDPMLGTEQDFRLLCRECHKRGIRVILDGVFNHNGSGSRYFNADGYYGTLGAAQSKDSPWYPWYSFTNWPTDYSSWWGIKTLPQVEESHPSYVDFIIENENSIVRRWLRAGADGWRLDVADELPDSFIEKLRTAAVEEKKDAIVIGEVWEDGSNKIAYGQRRKYLLGHETHGLMNYPFRVSAIDWLTGGDARSFMETMETIREHYPPAAFYSALNSLGTHDNPRILTLCGQSEDLSKYDRDWRAHFHLSHSEWQRGLRRVKLASTLLYTFPGSPTVYYGDEAGMQGCEDPFNRAPFPWGHENQELLAHYRTLGKLRRARKSLQKGSITYVEAQGGLLSFYRLFEDEFTFVLLNNNKSALPFAFPWRTAMARDALSRQQFSVRDGVLRVTLPPESGMVLVEE